MNVFSPQRFTDYLMVKYEHLLELKYELFLFHEKWSISKFTDLL